MPAPRGPWSAEIDQVETGDSSAFVRTTAIDSDGTLAANSDSKLASQKAVKTYVDANGGSSLIQKATVTLTANQIKSLTSSAGIQLVTGPGSGKMLNPVSAVIQYKAGATPYAAPSGNDYLAVGYGPPDTVGDSVFTTYAQTGGGGLTAVSNYITILGLNGAFSNAGNGAPIPAVADLQAAWENCPLYIWFSNTLPLTLGNGTIVATVYSTVVDLS